MDNMWDYDWGIIKGDTGNLDYNMGRAPGRGPNTDPNALSS